MNSLYRDEIRYRIVPLFFKSGTILYRHGGDLLHALNVAPGQVCNLTQ